MNRLRWVLGLCLICFSEGICAEPVPVVISPTLSYDASFIKTSNFVLTARCGSHLIGFLPTQSTNGVTAGVQPLGNAGSGFNDIYQVDRRAFQVHGDLWKSLDKVLETDTWALIRASGETLNTLSSAGIHFRAISGNELSFAAAGAGRDGIDEMDPFVGVILDQVSSSSYEGYILSLQNFITRNTYNSASVDAAEWILQQFQAMGLTAWMDTFQVGDSTRYNVIAEKTGTQYPEQIYYLTAHLDATAGLPVLPEDEAPGADDDGSGAAFVLESARVMAQFDFHYTVRFAVFSGNEQGLIGSEAYVSQLPLPGETYLGVFDADMIGWSGSDAWPPDLVIYTNDDPGSILLADKISEAVSLFVTGFLEPIVIQDPTMVYADHAPFWDVGIPGVLTMEDEAWGDDLNPYYHSVNDLLDYLDVPYAVHVLEALLAAAADLAEPNGSTDPYLTADGVQIDDSQGNNNGRIEYGESVFFTIPVINAGGADAYSVSVVLNENDPYITLTDWVENYGDILSQDTVSVTNAFSADVSVNVPDEYLFDISVLMSSGGDVWTSNVQVIAHAPDIVIDDVTVDDAAGGNGNGRLEPGETADFEITLTNEGSYQAENLSATLSCASPYVIINSPVQSYGTLAPDASGMRSFSVTALNTAPAYFSADFSLNYSAAGDWNASGGFTLDIGDITHLPTGPDHYGYSAYDVNDEPYGPVYNWIEIDPGQGGPGTELNFTADDQTLHLDLPFTFVYYGESFNEISVCSNGWVSCGYTDETDYSNSGIPDEDGPPAMIAPFWEDLSPQQEGSVSYYYDEQGGYFIIEYFDVRDFYPQWHNMTFEVILYDPAVYQTLTGDGKILFQYGPLDNTTSCTVGIENIAEDDGLQYLYNQNYDPYASTVASGMAILFTTGDAVPELSVELTYVSGSPVPPGGGNVTFDVYVENYGSVPLDYDAWLDIEYEGGVPTTVVQRSFIDYQPGWTINRPGMFFPVPASYAAGNYEMYGRVGLHPELVWDESGFPFVKSGDGPDTSFIPFVPEASFPNPFELLTGNDGCVAADLPREFKLHQNYPNPFNPTTVFPLALPQRSRVTINIFDVSGRLVWTIEAGVLNAGRANVHFNASRLASGVYFYRVTAEGSERGGRYQDVGKMLLLK